MGLGDSDIPLYGLAVHSGIDLLSAGERRRQTVQREFPVRVGAQVLGGQSQIAVGGYAHLRIGYGRTFRLRRNPELDTSSGFMPGQCLRNHCQDKARLHDGEIRAGPAQTIHGDFHSLLSGGSGFQSCDRNLTAAVGRFRDRSQAEVGVGRKDHRKAGNDLSVAFHREGHIPGVVLAQGIACLQRIARRIDLELRGQQLPVHRDLHGFRSRSRGREVERNLAAAVGVPRSRAQAEIGIGRKVHGKAGNGLVVAFYGEGHVRAHMLNQRLRGDGQVVGRGGDGELYGDGFAVHGDGHGLLAILYGRQADILNLTAGVGCLRGLAQTEIGVGRKGHAYVGYGGSFCGFEREGHVLLLILKQRGRIRLQLEVALRDGELHGWRLTIHTGLHGLLAVLYGPQADVLNLTFGVGPLRLGRQAQLVVGRKAHVHTGYGRSFGGFEREGHAFRLVPYQVYGISLQLVGDRRDLDSRGRRFPVHGDGGRRIRVERGGDAVNLERAVVVGSILTPDVDTVEAADGVFRGNAGHGSVVSGLQGEGQGFGRFPLFQRVAGGQFVAGPRYVDGSGYLCTIHRDFHIGRIFKYGCDGVGREFSVVVRGSRVGNVRAAKIADGVCDLRIPYRRVVPGLQGKGKGPGRFPLRQLVVDGQFVAGTRYVDGRLHRFTAQGDACLRIRAERGGDVADRKLTVLVRGGGAGEVCAAKIADGVRERYIFYRRIVVGRQGKGDGFGVFPLLQRVAGGQSIVCLVDGERHLSLPFSVHQDFNRLLSGEDGGQPRDLELPAGVGGLRVRRQTGEAFAPGEEHAQAGHRIAVAREGEGHVMPFMLVQSCLVGGQHIGRRRDGELRLGRGLAVHFGRKRLFPGEHGGQTPYGELPAAVRGI